MSIGRLGDFSPLPEAGPSIVSDLQTIRSRGPGAARRGALLALLHYGGESALDPADLAILRRLIQIKIVDDEPYSFDACFNSWLAVRGGDQDGIMRTLGLSDAVPATYGLGETLVSHLAHGGPGADDEFRHVFISPEINGWTIVRGPSCDPDRSPPVVGWVEQLSADYGEAQAYFYGSQGEGEAWIVAEGGQIIRRYSENEPEKCSGSPLAIEQYWLRHHGFTAPAEQVLADYGFQSSSYGADCSAPAVAAELSIDPVANHWPAQIRVRGHAIIGRTDEGLHQNVLRDCYTFNI